MVENTNRKGILGRIRRREFAEHIVYKFGATSPCILDSSDFINPFAQQIARLFNGQITCIFIKADGLTTLCLSGSLKLKIKIQFFSFVSIVKLGVKKQIPVPKKEKLISNLTKL